MSTTSRFCRGAHIDVRNKKGNTPLWLAANGGHFDVVQLLVHASADVDAADNRKITPLMAAFRKVCRVILIFNVLGHILTNLLSLTI